MPDVSSRPRGNDPTWLLLLVAVVALAAALRWHQYQAWQRRPELHFDRRTPMVTSLDAHRWLRWVEEPPSTTDGGRDELRFYPDGRDAPTSMPLPSRVLAALAGCFGGDAQRAGFFVFPALALLFVVPVAAYAVRLGVPEVGVLAALVGSLSSEYLTRTAIGRVDTDALILFFPWLAATAVLAAATARSHRAVLLWSALAGLSLLAFEAWYGHPLFALAFALTLAVTLAATAPDRRRLALAAVAVAVFVVAAGPDQLRRGVDDLVATAGRYVHIAPAAEHHPPAPAASAVEAAPPATPMLIPNVMGTISEAARQSPREALARCLAPPWLAALGLGALLVAVPFRWRLLLPVAPFLPLAALALGGSRRFTIFLAPLVGLGLGLGLAALVERWRDRLPPQRARLLWVAATVAIAALALGPALAQTPRPALPPLVHAALADLATTVPAGSPVYTWWDTGFAVADLAQRATFHDGGCQDSMKTHFIARSLASPSQFELANTVAFLARHGDAGLKELLNAGVSGADLVERVTRHASPAPEVPVFLLLTLDMVPKLAAIAALAGDGSGAGYLPLPCTALDGSILRCDASTVDLDTGTGSDGLRLARAALIADGAVAEHASYPHPEGPTLQIMTVGGEVVGCWLLPEAIYRSNFNQLFFLARPDRGLLTPVPASFPAARVYRLGGGNHPEQR